MPDRNYACTFMEICLAFVGALADDGSSQAAIEEISQPPREYL